MNGTNIVEIQVMKRTWTRGALALILAGGVAACGDAQADGTDEEQASAGFSRNP